MKNKTLAVMIAVMLPLTVWAIAETVERNDSARPTHFTKGIYVGTDSSRAVADTKNKLKHTGAELIDYAFPALPDDGGTTGVACQLSVPSATVEGAQVGDPCAVGVRLPGTVVNDLQTDVFFCTVTASNTVKVRRCGDRAAAALVDSGYEVRTLGYK